MKMKKSKLAAWVLAFGLAVFPHTALASESEEETWEPWEFMNVNVEGYDAAEDADEIETYDACPEEDAQEDVGSELLDGDLEEAEEVGEEDMDGTEIDGDGVALPPMGCRDAEGCGAEGESEDVDASECEPAVDPQSGDISQEPSVAVQEDDGVSCGKAYAASRDDAIAGVYTVAKRTPLQATANAGDTMLLDMDENAEVHCYGYYTEMDGVKWFYVQYFQDGKTFTGFCGSENLTSLSTPRKMWNIL